VSVYCRAGAAQRAQITATAGLSGWQVNRVLNSLVKLIIDMWAGNRAGRPAATREVIEVRLSASRCCQPNGGAENNDGTGEKFCDQSLAGSRI
jgi:hypothetical protein